MPMTRSYDMDANTTTGRKPFRPVTDFKRARGNGNGHGHGNARPNAPQPQRATPPEVTNAENFYYLKQMNSRTPMVLVLTDGEEIRGWIEWYDRACLKINREGAPNLLVQKHSIKYLFKQEDLVE
jgi:sRNA-binding regulator protein Hfq